MDASVPADLVGPAPPGAHPPGPPASLRGETLRLASGRVLAAAVSALWFVVAARELSVAEFGSLALLLGIGLMLAVVADFGMSNLLADVVAADPATARPATRHIVKIRLVLAVPTSAAIVGAYLVAGGLGGWQVPGVFAVSIFATTIYSSFGAVFRATGRAVIDGGNEFVSRLFVLALGWIVLASGGGLFAAVAVYSSADLFSAIVMGAIFRAVTAYPAAPPPPGSLTLRRAGSLGFTNVVGNVYYRLDLWLLALIKSPRTVARYSAAYRIFDGLLLPATAVAALAVPYSSQLEGRELVHRLHRLAFLAFVISLPGTIVGLVFAEPLLRFIFGPPYASGAEAFRILLVAIPVSACVLALLPPLALRSARTVVMMSVALVVNVIMNLALIPSYGATGAALATLAGQVLLLAMLAAEMRRVQAVR
jgi:O-antigen/teichoic acid export membrane protein